LGRPPAAAISKCDPSAIGTNAGIAMNITAVLQIRALGDKREQPASVARTDRGRASV
jgi:hypothetical protein